MKLALGTAQFGFNYGIANTSGQVQPKEVAKIIKFAEQAGINTLDTAIAYQQSEATLGSIGVKDWQITTKLPSLPNNETNIRKWIEKQALESIQRLGVKHIYGLLLHNPNQLFNSTGDELLNSLVKIKNSGLVEKIGISIYSPSELECLFKLYTFDIVQSPLNILDQRLVRTGWAEKLNKKGIEIHSRSCFLQGLLLMKESNRPTKFTRWKNLWDMWTEWLATKEITALQACLLYPMSIQSIDKVIVGVDSLSQLQQILLSCEKTIDNFPDWSEHYDDTLINPALWGQL